MRRRRALGRRMCEYDGVPYDDRVASSSRVRTALDRTGERRIDVDDPSCGRPETIISVQRGSVTEARDGS